MHKKDKKCPRCFNFKPATEFTNGYTCSLCQEATRNRNERIHLNRLLRLENKKFCPQCKEIKILTNFYRHSGILSSRLCKDCAVVKSKEYKELKGNNSTQYYNKNPLAKVYSSSKDRAKKKGIDFNITLEFLKILLTKQNGRCIISNIPFDHSRKPYRISIDRIDCSKGYIKDNVRLVLWGVNAAMNAWGLNVYLEIAKEAIKVNERQILSC